MNKTHLTLSATAIAITAGSFAFAQQTTAPSTDEPAVEQSQTLPEAVTERERSKGRWWHGDRDCDGDGSKRGDRDRTSDDAAEDAVMPKPADAADTDA